VNADGSVIVGWSNDAALSVSRAFRWTAATGMVSLGNLPGGDECVANGANADGSEVVGSDYVVDAQWNSTQTAWRWTAATGMVSLGQLPGGQASEALAVSPDGQLIVGWAEQSGSSHAFVWDASHGMRELKAVLKQQGVSGLGGWTLDAATGMAGDLPWTIAGTGADSLGSCAGWVAHLDPGFGGSWISLGSGLAGSAGVPQLAGTGSLVAGSSVTVTLSSARPNAAALLFVSTSSTPAPFKGGTLVPVPIVAMLALATSPAGGITLPIDPWPAGLPSGAPIYWQYGVQDPAAVHGVALSNALKSTLP
jgi:probable HAF family extracellular repeat protein